jgi:hypothetical protein
VVGQFVVLVLFKHRSHMSDIVVKVRRSNTRNGGLGDWSNVRFTGFRSALTSFCRIVQYTYSLTR